MTNQNNNTTGLITRVLAGVGALLLVLAITNFSFKEKILPVVPEVVEITGSSLKAVNDAVTVQKVVKKVKKLDLPADRTLFLIGEVNGNALGLANRINSLNKVNSNPIYLFMTSPGGSVLTGSILISAMQASKAPVYTIASGLCASMCFMISQYGVERYAVDRTIMMSHPASAGTQGDVDRMYSFIKTLKGYTNKLEADVATRMGLTFDQYKALIVNELWLDAEDSVSYKIIDQIVNVSIPEQTPGSSDANERYNRIYNDNFKHRDFLWL